MEIEKFFFRKFFTHAIFRKFSPENSKTENS
jgi:hypothetical protein